MIKQLALLIAILIPIQTGAIVDNIDLEPVSEVEKLKPVNIQVEYEKPHREPVSKPVGDIEGIIRATARKYGLSEEYFLKIAMCESTLNPTVVNYRYTAADGSNPTGVFQFIKSTYLSFAPRAGLPAQDDRLNPNRNIEVAGWAFANGYSSHWACN